MKRQQDETKKGRELIIKSSNDKNNKRERGNIFFTLFGAVAVVGLLGTGIMSTLKGPLSTMVEINRIEEAKADMRINVRLILTQPAELDTDTLQEPIQPDTCTIGVAGAGCIPSTLGAKLSDPWGNDYAYCAWNLGTDSTAIAPNILEGDINSNFYTIAIISAGPDLDFDSSCTGAPPNISEGGDDIVIPLTYEQALASSGGLWTLDDTDPNEAEIDKNIEVQGSGTFTGGLDLTAPSSLLRLGAASLILPTEAQLTTCNGANENLLRVLTTTTPNTVQICDTSGNFVSAGSLWTYEGSGVISYNDGDVDIGNALTVTGATALNGGVTTTTLTATGATDLDSTLNVDGDTTLQDTLFVGGSTNIDDTLNVISSVDFDTTLNVDGDTTLVGALDVDGDTTVDILNASEAVDFDTTLNVDGDTTLVGALDVDGDTTVDILNASDAVDFDTTLNVDGDTDIGGTLDVTGDITTDGTVYINNGENLDPQTCASGNRIYWDGDSWECESEIDGGSGTGGTLEINDLDDVNTSGVGNNDCLTYNTSSGDWEAEGCDENGVFEVTGIVGAEVVNTNNSNAPHATSDFVFGSPQLDNTGTLSNYNRMFFDKSLGAFRAGRGLNTDDWDEANLGLASFAAGQNTRASGDYSAALGLSTNATGNYSLATGQGSTASGRESTAMGFTTIASGSRSFALGFRSTASGLSSIALGHEVRSTNSYTASIGLSNQSDTDANRPQVSGLGSLGIFMDTATDYNLSANDQLGIIGGELMIDGSFPNDTPADLADTTKGCIRYNDTDDQLEFSNDCTTYVSFADAGSAALVFEVTGTPGDELIRTVNTNAPYATSDFLIGSPQLDDDNDVTHDSRLFFDKSKGAFRAGTAQNAEWDAGNTGTNSIVLGLNSTASGQSSVAIGESNTASGDGSTAIGVSNTASLTGATALGAGTVSSGVATLTTGLNTTASSVLGTAMGQEVKATGIQNTFAIGLAEQTDTDADRPEVSGEGSLGIFMDTADNYNLALTDTLGIISGQLMIDGDVDPTQRGCIQYNDIDELLEFSNDCTTYTPIASTDNTVFEVTGTTGAELVRTIDTSAPYATSDFVFGSTQLDDTGNTDHDNRMFFDKSKGAFRAGSARETQWDDANVGIESMAWGTNAIASNFQATAWGFGATASATQATAWGSSTTASANQATAWGQGTTASANQATAWGLGPAASNFGATAWGQDTVASGQYSTVWGSDNASTSFQSTAWGRNTTASAFAATAWGTNTTASGSWSTAFGDEVTANGDLSTAIGLQSANQTTDPIITGDRSMVLFFDGGVADANSAYDFTETDTFGIVGGEIMIDGSIGTTPFVDTNKGCIRYNDDDDVLEFSNDCSTYDAIAGANSAVFEVTGAAGDELVRQMDAVAPLATSDFLFGSTQLGDTSNPDHDSRMFFDKSKGAFRAGEATTTRWDDVNVGENSTAMGHNTTASGIASVAIGNNITASGDNSTAIGTDNTASGPNTVALGRLASATGDTSIALGSIVSSTGTASFAAGRTLFATGNFSTAMGFSTTASGGISVAMGSEVKAAGLNSFAFGLSDQSNTDADRPQVSGDGSFGIFMDTINNYNLSATDQLGIIGGELMIDGTTGTSPFADANKGCIRYNDDDDTLEFSDDCTTYASFASLSNDELALNDLTDAITDYTTDNNIIVGGDRTGASIATGAKFNTVFGQSAFTGTTNAAADNNTAFGFQSLSSITSGNRNTGFGVNTLRDSTTGTNNTASGYNALRDNIGGVFNTASGVGALLRNTGGNNNTAYGVNALGSNLTGNRNTASGVNALRNSTGADNTALGYNAGNNITSGSSNIIIGSNTQAPSATANNQLNIGNTIYGDTSTGNVGIGTSSGLNSQLNILHSGTIGGNSANETGAGLKITNGSLSMLFDSNEIQQFGNILNLGGENGIRLAVGDVNDSDGIRAAFIDTDGEFGIGDFLSDDVESALHIQSGDIRIDGGADNEAGCIRYDDTDDTLEFSDDCSTYVSIADITASATLQNAYNNSTSPEILTDATLGALTLKRGSAADTDNVLEILDGSDATNFSVSGEGILSTASRVVAGTDNASIPSGSTGTSLFSTNPLFAFIGTNTLANDTRKFTRFAGANFSSEGTPILAFLVDSVTDNTANLNIGGGTSAALAPTDLRFYTSDTTIGTTGVERMRFDRNGFATLSTNTTINGSLTVTDDAAEQFSSGYDATNYWSADTSSAGLTTFNAEGTTAEFTFADAVSIGSTPAYNQPRPLKVYDNGDAGGARVSIIGTSGVANTPAIEFVIDGSVARRALLRMENEGANDYGLSFFVTNSATVTKGMQLTGDGNLGIGTDTPTTQLHVASGEITIDDDNANGKGCIRYNDTDDALEFSDDCITYSSLSSLGNDAIALNDLTDAITDYDTANSIYIGNNAGVSAPNTAIRNVALGIGALSTINDADADINTAVGHQTLQSSTAGRANTAIGYRASRLNTTGIDNTALGALALSSNALGSNNVAIGSGSLSASSGSNNTAIGRSTLVSTTGDNNIALGYQAADNLTTGSNNIIIGYDIDASAVDVDNELNIGDAIYGDLATGNVGIGEATPTSALHVNTRTATNIGLQVDMVASQTANPIEIQNSSGTALFEVDELGNISAGQVNSTPFTGTSRGVYVSGATNAKLILDGAKEWVTTSNSGGSYALRNETDNVNAFEIRSTGHTGIGMGSTFGSFPSPGRLNLNDQGSTGSQTVSLVLSNQGAANTSTETQQDFRLNDSGGVVTVSRFAAGISDTTDGASDGTFTLQTRLSDILTDRIVARDTGIELYGPDVTIGGTSGGDTGCIRYNDTDDVLEFSDDCTTYSSLTDIASGTNLWQNDGTGGPAEIHYDAGDVLIGDDDGTLFDNGPASATFKLLGDAVFLNVGNTAAGKADVDLYRARGTVASRSAIVDGDTLGSLRFSGWDGDSYEVSAQIEARTDGTVANGDAPGEIDFLTKEDGGSLTSKMIIKNDGNVGIGTDDPSAQTHIVAVAADKVGQIIQGAASQTANFFELKDSDDNAIFTIDPQGNTTITNQVQQDLKLILKNEIGATGSDTSAVEVWGQNSAKFIGRNNLGTQAFNFGFDSNVGGVAVIGYGGSSAIRMDPSNKVTIARATSDFLGQATIVGDNSTPAFPVLVTKGAAAQTGNLTEWRNSADTVLGLITSDGDLQLGTLSDTAQVPYGKISIGETDASILVQGGIYAEANSASLDLVGGFANNAVLNHIRIKGTRTTTSVGNDGANLDFIAMARITEGDTLMRITEDGNVGIGTGAVNPAATLEVAGTDSILFPRGTTAQQPSVPVNGMMRYNSDNDKFEAYQGGAWQDILTAAVGNSVLSDLTAATADNTIANAANEQVWNWELAAAETGMTFGESAASAGGSDDQYILAAKTLAASTAMPLYVENAGDGDSFRVADAASDTSPFIIDADGNVGIGTNAPARAFEISRSATHYQMRIGKGGSVSYDIGRNDTDGILSFYGNQTGFTGYRFSGVDGERMRIDSSGNVGIGTDSPDLALDVRKEDADNASVTTVLRLQHTTSGTAAAGIGTAIRFDAERANGDLLEYGRISSIVTGVGTGGGANGDLAFFTRQDAGTNNVIEAMRIDHEGNLGIGTTAPDEALHVVGDLKVEGSTTTCILGAGSGSTNCTSDERLKTDITVIPSALDKIDQLRGVTFTWKDKTKTQDTQIGVIAQDVEKVFPEIVGTLNDEAQTKTVDYAALVAPLIEATKELKAENEALRKDVKALKAHTNFNTSKGSFGIAFLLGLLSMGLLSSLFIIFRQKQS